VQRSLDESRGEEFTPDAAQLTGETLGEKTRARMNVRGGKGRAQEEEE
jgi:hypothetical protein